MYVVMRSSKSTGILKKSFLSLSHFQVAFTLLQVPANHACTVVRDPSFVNSPSSQYQAGTNPGSTPSQ